jgi:excisionase family DNA binding protein
MLGEPMASTDNDYPRAALRVSEACTTLGLSRSKLYEELSAGRLKAVKCGSRTLIPTASIEAWLAALPALPGTGAAANRNHSH